MLLFTAICFGGEGQIKWFAFKKAFVASHYATDSAIGSLKGKAFHPPKNIHAISCGGEDGELHIGIALDEIDLSATNKPPSFPVNENDSGWGVVAELPNAKEGDGPQILGELNGKAATFIGYFRVWNEGHWKGQLFPRNPHHVLEVHPAWSFAGGGVNFEGVDLVKSIDRFSGYGASKFKKIFSSMASHVWPHAFQDSDSIHVEFIETGNFFQLPVTVKNIHKIAGGTR